MVKKLLTIGLVSILVIITGMLPSYAKNEVGLRDYISDINKRYGLNLEVEFKNSGEITAEEIEEAKKEFLALAKKQSILLQYLENRDKLEVMNLTLKNKFNIYSARSSTVKTATKPTWDEGEYSFIRATYTIYDKSTISLCRNTSLGVYANAEHIYTLSDYSKPTLKVIDSGRTSTVQYTATRAMYNWFNIKRLTYYTEFYYND